MDKLNGHDIRALLTTIIIVIGVLLFVAFNAITAAVNRQHEWRMAMLDKSTRTYTGEDGKDDASGVRLVPHPSIPGAYLTLDVSADVPIDRPRPRPIKDNPQA